jgi:hypothetical protein
MGKKQWTTPDQRTWLQARISTFTTAQVNRSTATFFESTYRGWHKKWPTPAPTEKDIDDAKGDLERARATLQKKMEEVRLHYNVFIVIPILPVCSSESNAGSVIIPEVLRQVPAHEAFSSWPQHRNSCSPGKRTYICFNIQN